MENHVAIKIKLVAFLWVRTERHDMPGIARDLCRTLEIHIAGLPMIPDLQAQEAPVVNVKVKVGVSHAAVAQAEQAVGRGHRRGGEVHDDCAARQPRELRDSALGESDGIRATGKRHIAGREHRLRVSQGSSRAGERQSLDAKCKHQKKC